MLLRSLFNSLSLSVIIALAACNSSDTNKASAQIKQTGSVTDIARILEGREVADLARKIKGIHDKHNAIVDILIIKDIPEDKDIESFANHIFNEWKVGAKDIDNGILVLLALGPKKIRIEVGRGMEGDIPDLRARQVIDKMRGDFGKRNFYMGFVSGLSEISKILDNKKG